MSKLIFIKKSEKFKRSTSHAPQAPPWPGPRAPRAPKDRSRPPWAYEIRSGSRGRSNFHWFSAPEIDSYGFSWIFVVHCARRRRRSSCARIRRSSSFARTKSSSCTRRRFSSCKKRRSSSCARRKSFSSCTKKIFFLRNALERFQRNLVPAVGHGKDFQGSSPGSTFPRDFPCPPAGTGIPLKVHLRRLPLGPPFRDTDYQPLL